MSEKINEVRIIGGQWRGRKIRFPNQADLRPSPDRVRETLFNWLATVVPKAICLDLFAGSGVLGFEALSRGAAEVTFIDDSKIVVEQLKKNIQTWDVNNAFVYQAKLPGHLPHLAKQFDVVFLDPPFHKDMLAPCCALLDEASLLKKNAYVYIEAEKELTELPIPNHWQVLKNKVAGNVGYYLVGVVC